MEDIILKIEGDMPDVEGKTFQMHLLPGNRIRLYPVIIPIEAGRCPSPVSWSPG
jgi:hypothetical protein